MPEKFDYTKVTPSTRGGIQGHVTGSVAARHGLRDRERTQMSTAVLRAAVENLIQNGRKTLAERTVEAAHLTQEEAEVLRLMGNAESNKTIAATLGITLDTTKKHVRNVIDKLQARSRTHAAIIAAQAGLVGKPVNGIAAVLKAQSKPGSCG